MRDTNDNPVIVEGRCLCGGGGRGRSEEESHIWQTREIANCMTNDRRKDCAGSQKK